jgi:hypothetical protein
MFQVLLRGETNVHYLLTRSVYIFILPLMLFDGIFFFLFCLRGQNKFLQFVLRAYSFWVITLDSGINVGVRLLIFEKN